MVRRRLFERVVADSTPLLFWNVAWLLTIVVLPFPTEMIGGYVDDWFTAVLYVGTILASSICLTVLALMIHGPVGASGAVSTTTILVVAFVLMALVPGVTYFALLLLVFSSVVNRVVTPLLRHVEERRAEGRVFRPTPPR
ncbi:MAG: potassium channel family protein [Pseudonocardia sp.]